MTNEECIDSLTRVRGVLEIALIPTKGASNRTEIVARCLNRLDAVIAYLEKSKHKEATIMPTVLLAWGLVTLVLCLLAWIDKATSSKKRKP